MISILLCFLSGLLATLSFPGFSLSYLVWISLVFYFAALYGAKTYKESILYGFVFGAAYFGGVFYWLTSTSRWVGIAGYLAWAGLALYQSIFIILFSYFAWLIIKYSHKQIHTAALPSLWIFFEWLRQAGEFGSPGGYLGNTQYLNTALIQIADFSGVWGVSYLIVSVNLIIALLLLQRGNILKRIVSLAAPLSLVCVLLAASYSYGIVSLKKERGSAFINKTTIAIVQPSVPQEVKLDPRNLYPTLDRLLSLTKSSFPNKPEIVIWPETAVMTYLEDDKAALLKVKRMCEEGKVFLICGAFYRKDGKIYNSVFSISPTGETVSRYDKHHLMPFGEYLPFKAVFYPFLKSTGFFDQDQSQGTGSAMINAAGRSIGTMICFESLFEELGKERAKNADLLLTLTNDAWFGKSLAAEQHISAGVFRAIENRKYFIQSANTGITAVIDPRGRFIKKSRLNREEVIIFDLSGSK
ncbi:MAG: apolipoprotein N-acyltransferase [Candidatus Margulisiibacteriota bacterium]